nr:type II toxin-antitoxin system PemK/MazF family toxin [Clostridium sp. MCC353]
MFPENRVREGRTKVNILRGDLYYADLTPVTGSEQGGVRPVLMIQNDMGNRFSPTVIVAAVTSRQDKHPLPTHVPINPKPCGLKEHSVVLLEQIRTIDRVRLREYIGRLTEEDMRQVDHALRISIGLS